MNLALVLIALLTLASAGVALARPNLIHSALLLIASWMGIAAFYLWAGAEFIAFAQVLVYVGAVSMVVLFAVLLTRRSRADLAVGPASAGRAAGALLAGGAVLAVLAHAVIATPLTAAPGGPRSVTVRELGLELLGPHAAALLAVGLILTLALLGAVLLAAGERREPEEPRP